jgi:hypothetical protein
MSILSTEDAENAGRIRKEKSIIMKKQPWVVIQLRYTISQLMDEWNAGNIERAVKRRVIAANLGCNLSLKQLKREIW